MRKKREQEMRLEILAGSLMSYKPENLTSSFFKKKIFIKI